MLASTTTRVYQSAFFALRDTRTPARIAALRVLVSAMAGAYLMLQFEPVTVFGIAVPAGAFADVTVSGVALGPVGLGLGASLGAWLEWFLLRRRLRGAVGDIGTGFAPISRMIAGSGFAAAAGFAAGLVVSDLQPLLSAFVVAAVFGAVYVGAGIAFGLPQARAFAEAGLRLIRLNRRL
jgi:putative peptidoglycan lipid II flippase